MLTASKINKSTVSFLKGFVCSLIILIIGFFSGFSTSNEIQTWYVTIIKPDFNPPNFIFGPVWTLLYILMGISLTLIASQKPSVDRTKAITIFIIQFILNLCWSIIFFKMHEIGWALVEIVFMWVSILIMIVWFYRLQRTAALLQIPYLVWVSFASVLNGSIYFLNWGIKAVVKTKSTNRFFMHKSKTTKSGPRKPRRLTA